MNTLKHYLTLIRKAEVRQKPEGYTERHHIFPVSVFGDNNRVVVLTAREHYVAHLLLWKTFQHRYGDEDIKTIKLAHAYCLMCVTRVYNSHLYQIARVQASKWMSLVQTGRRHSQESKDKRSQKLSGKPKSQEHKDNVSKARRGLLYWNDGTKNKMCVECPGEGWVRGQLKRSGFKRKPHSNESKQRMSRKATLRRLSRDKNGRFTKDL